MGWGARRRAQPSAPRAPGQRPARSCPPAGTDGPRCRPRDRRPRPAGPRTCHVTRPPARLEPRCPGPRAARLAPPRLASGGAQSERAACWGRGGRPGTRAGSPGPAGGWALLAWLRAREACRACPGNLGRPWGWGEFCCLDLTYSLAGGHLNGTNVDLNFTTVTRYRWNPRTGTDMSHS